MITEKFKKFIAVELGVSVNEIESITLSQLFSIDVRPLHPSLFSNAIMFWCWLFSKVKWSKRWSHCAGVEIWKVVIRIGETIATKNVAVTYDASYHYERNIFNDWCKEYEIINICDVDKSLNLEQHEERLVVHNNHESMIGTPYGKKTILGLFYNDITKAITIGVDGKDEVICSEAEMYSVRDYILSEPNEPFDYIDIIERGDYIPMSKYNGELDDYK